MAARLDANGSLDSGFGNGGPDHQADADGGRLRSVWHRIRLTVQEMNYSARRIVEAQAPWIVDEKPHSR